MTTYNNRELLATLSPRERQVFELIADGMPPQKMATQIGVSTKTISTYRARIIEKLGVRSNAEMAMFLHRARTQEVLDDVATRRINLQRAISESINVAGAEALCSSAVEMVKAAEVALRAFGHDKAAA